MNRTLTLLLIVTIAFVTLSAQSKTSRQKKDSKQVSVPVPKPYRELLDTAQQIIVVTTAGWNSVDGSLTRYEKHEGKWQPIGDNIPIVVAKNGLGWDALIEVPSAEAQPVKKEGDGRSPAGVFPITELFGFDPENASAKLPYVALTETTECVDDANSSSYNRIVDLKDFPHPDWDSSEKMRTIDVYKLGAVVGYNPLPSPGAGSCIFLHIWRGAGHGTAGCTAMNETQLKEVLNWLDGTKHPIMVQFPAPVYQRIRSSWNLP